MLGCIKLIHFHLGSQITKIRKIKNGLRECSQFYVQMRKIGCDIQYVDIGGGLGVDYDGSRSTSPHSINYAMQEYANDAISMFQDACEKNLLPHPNIITESGRSLTAHHSVLVFNVLETATLPAWDYDYEVNENDHEIVRDLYQIHEILTPSNMLESWHDALQMREDALDLFSLGLLDLKTRALTESLFWSIANEINRIALEIKHIPEELRVLSKMLADKYFCNFSVFQSLPDSWAIDQIFPIMPIHRLNEKPTQSATIQDITCDSDGKIDRFVGARDYANYLQLQDRKSVV